ncbi:replication factor A1 [Pseudohyphozyma bogoriensis]|nr:replication factor A1 [Pseudohyphozyma bogoriensis]
MDFELSKGSVAALFAKQTAEDNPILHEPVLQVLSLKKISSQGSGDRYRLLLSDGEYFTQGMLATTLNHLIASETPSIDKNTVIRLTSYASNMVQNRQIIICLGLETLAHLSEKIGTPASVDTSVAESAPAAPAPAPAAAPAGRGGSNASMTAAAKKGPQAAKGKMAGQGGAPIYPIESLSPYQNKWTIKARVTQKSDIRHWSNARGDGKLFSVNLLDESGEIKATGFNDAVDNLYPIFEEGKVYLISKARVNIAKKQFSNLSNEYEIAFENNTEVQLCDDQDSAPQIKYAFIDLAELGAMEKDATCDVLGIVTDNGQLGEVTGKVSQKTTKKRDLTIADRSGYQCRVTLWGRQAEMWQDSDYGVYAFKGAKVGDFGGRTLSMGGQSTIAADPDIPEAHELVGWYQTEGSQTSFLSHSNGGGGAGSFKSDVVKTISQIDEDGLGLGEKPDFFSTRATVILIRPENMWYPACPSEGCNKKISMESEDRWKCEKCDKYYEGPQYRYILGMCVSDFSGQTWISCFNDTGETIMGKTANEMNMLKEEDEGAYSAAIANATGRMYSFGLRAKAEFYQDTSKVKTTVQKVAPMNWVEESRKLITAISSYA